MSHIVEKPAPDKAPSTLAVLGRYVLEPEVFEHLRAIPRGAGGEMQLTDAIAAHVAVGHDVRVSLRGTALRLWVERRVRGCDRALCEEGGLFDLARAVQLVIVVCSRPQPVQPERQEEHREVAGAYQQKRPENPPVGHV